MAPLHCLVFICVLVSCFAEDLLVTKKVYFDLAEDGIPIGRIEIGLFGDVVPKTAKNFYELVTHQVSFPKVKKWLICFDCK